MKTKEQDRAKEQAEAQLESIKEMVKTLRYARELDKRSDNAESQRAMENAEQTIHEDALEVVIRDGWYDPCKPESQYIEEYKILLCTGGPAVRIIGTVESGSPDTARLEYQDWGTPWTEYRLSSEEEETVLEYAGCFYFGE